MHCPRLDHFARIVPGNFPNTTSVTNCCVMIEAPTFSSYEEMMHSQWLKDTKQLLDEDKFPKECIRCQEKEGMGLMSERTYWVDQHPRLQSVKPDYLTVALKLDNICNTACQFCKPCTSSKIASLQKHKIKIYETGNFYDVLPVDRISQIDFEGGEPSNSKNVSQVLQNLPKNVKDIKIYTNGRSFIKELESLVEKKVRVHISISLDGVGKVQEYVRWPTKWQEYTETVTIYKEFMAAYPDLISLNFFTTVCALNVNDIENITNFANEFQISISISKLSVPIVLDIKKTNKFTLKAKKTFEFSQNQEFRKLAQCMAVEEDNTQQLDGFIQQQDWLREIDIADFITLENQD